MTVAFVERADAQVTRWQNGAGTTRELYVDEQNDEVRFRVSVARIEHGAAFSSFADLDRQLVWLGSTTLTLDIDGATRALQAHDRIWFSGASAVRCAAPALPGDALNVMSRAGGPRPTVGIVTGTPGTPRIVAPRHHHAMVITLSGQPRASGDAHDVQLNPMDSAHVIDASVTFTGRYTLAVVEFP